MQNKRRRDNISLSTHSAYIPADVQGLSDQEFFNAVDQMLKTIYQFASPGSGWKVQQLNEINIKMVKNSPIRGSSFIELPRSLRKHKKWLLNVRNSSDHRCFAYCFTAAYHEYFKQRLTSNTQTEGTATLSNLKISKFIPYGRLTAKSKRQYTLCAHQKFAITHMQNQKPKRTTAIR